MAWSLMSYKNTAAEKSSFDLDEHEGIVSGAVEKEVKEDTDIE